MSERASARAYVAWRRRRRQRAGGEWSFLVAAAVVAASSPPPSNVVAIGVNKPSPSGGRLSRNCQKFLLERAHTLECTKCARRRCAPTTVDVEPPAKTFLRPAVLNASD